MALSEDSRTLLQLLLGRGKSYSDISGLLGIDESEVRDRAHQALTEINGSDPDKDLNLTDYLLGQSDPISRADVARELSENPGAAETASDLSDQLRLLVPGADLPRIAGGKVTPAKRGLTSRGSRSEGSASAKAKSPGSSSSGPLTGSQRRMIAIILLVALLVTVLILFLSGAIGGSDDDSTPSAGPESAQAVLQPVGKQTGAGKVELGKSNDQFAARLQFTNLEPSTKSDSYVLWTDGAVGSFPLDETKVDKTGAIDKTIVIPAVVLCSIANDIFTTFKLSELNAADRQEVLAQTTKAAAGKLKTLPDYKGKTKFVGPIVIDPDLKTSIASKCSSIAGTPNTGTTP